MRLKFLALLTVALLCIAFVRPAFSAAPSLSNPYCVITNSNTSLDSCIAATIPLALIGILLSLTLSALVYMLGTILPQTGLQGWYKNELKETAKSAIILIVVFSVMAILSGIAVTFLSGVTPASTSNTPANIITTNLQGMYATAMGTYLLPQIHIATGMFYEMLGLDDAIALVKSIEISLYVPIPIVLPLPPYPVIGSIDSGVAENIYSMSASVAGTSSDPGSSIVSDAATVIVVPTLIILQMQYDIMLIIVIAGLGVLIPAGMVLRAIPFLRSIGSMFIALGIGAALVYPSLLLFFNLPVSSYLTPAQQSLQGYVLPNGEYASSSISPLIYSFISGAANGVQAELNHNFFYGPSQISGSDVDALSYFLTGFSSGLLAPLNLYPILNVILSMKFIDVLAQFIMFVFDIVIGVVIVQDISRVLGGPPTLTFGVGRLKLA